jgi:hypothetical protein
MTSTFRCRWIGDLKNEEEVLAWLTHQLESEEIEDVTDEMLDVLIGKMPNLAVLFCTFPSKHFTIIVIVWSVQHTPSFEWN